MAVFGYRPLKSYNLVPSGTYVNVIASFKASGEFIPLYFQASDSSGERFSYKIISISSIKDKPGLKIFVCNFIVNESKQTIILQYELENMRWLVGEA